MKIIIQSIKNYFKSKKDRGLEPVFFEKIGDQKTSRDQMRENLIKALKKFVPLSNLCLPCFFAFRIAGKE